jgi:hypothetical protein
VRFVTNAKVSAPELFKVAFQVPLILPATFEFDPHPESARLAASKMTAAILFIKKFLKFSGSAKRHLQGCRHQGGKRCQASKRLSP